MGTFQAGKFKVWQSQIAPTRASERRLRVKVVINRKEGRPECSSGEERKLHLDHNPTARLSFVKTVSPVVAADAWHFSAPQDDRWFHYIAFSNRLERQSYGCRPVTHMYGFWVLSAWVLLCCSLTGGALSLAAAIGKPIEHALPRTTAGLILVLSAVLVLVLCRSQAGQQDGLLRQSLARPEISDSAIQQGAITEDHLHRFWVTSIWIINSWPPIQAPDTSPVAPPEQLL